jgi:peroxiredoxin
MNRLIAFLVIGLFVSPQLFAAVEVHTLDIGASAPDFNLPGVDGKNYTLKDFASAKILIVVFTCNHCPTAQAYEERIKQMASDYKDKGAALVAINPNNPGGLLVNELRYSDLSDSFDEMKMRAKDQQFNFPYLYDGDEQKTAHAYGCIATPHVFIFDADRKLRYQGRIDDSDVKTVHHTDARDAVDALLAGKAVAVETTHVFGCSTKWIEKSAGAKEAEAKWDKEAVTLSSIDAAGVQKLVANDSKNLRLINVWATWCVPCVHEMPELLTINRQFRTRPFETVTISMDDPANKDQVLKYLSDHHLAFDNHIWSSDDKDALVNALDKTWQGPVPFTLLVAPGGKVLYRQTGAVDVLELKKAIVGYLGRTYAPAP